MAIEVQIFGTEEVPGHAEGAPVLRRAPGEDPLRGPAGARRLARGAPAVRAEVRRGRAGGPRVAKRFADLGLGARALSATSAGSRSWPRSRCCSGCRWSACQQRLDDRAPRNDLEGVDWPSEPVLGRPASPSSSAPPGSSRDVTFTVEPGRALGHRRPERHRQDDPVPAPRRRRPQPTRGTVARRVRPPHLADGPAPRLRRRDARSGRRPPGRSPSCSRWSASLAEQAAALGGGDPCDAAMLTATTATSSASSTRAATPSPPAIDAVLHGLGFDPEEARTQPRWPG